MAVTINGSTGIEYDDDVKQIFGTGDDLQIQHTSGHSRITQSGSGNLIVEVTTTDSDLVLRAEDIVSLQPHNGNEGVVCNAQGSTELYYNNIKKLQTDSAGTTIVGHLHLNSADNHYIKMGAGNDLQIYHDGTNSWIDNGTGNLLIRDNTGDIYLQAPLVSLQGGTSESNKQTAKFTAGGSVELYHNDSKKFETTSAGGTLTGNWTGKVGLQEADQWRVNTAFTMSTSGAFITSNWERVDTDNFGKIGTGMTESSGIFSFPSTGIWKIDWFYTTLNTAGDSKYNDAKITVTTNNSSYGEAASCFTCNDTTDFITSGSTSFIFDVTDTSTHKVQIYNYAWSGNTTFKGDSTTNENALTFIRLGDT